MEETDNLREAFDFLQKETPEMCEKICQRLGLTTPYIIQFCNLSDTENQDKDIVLTPGNPPILIISDLFILQCITERKHKSYYRARIEAGLERIYKVHRTLGNLVSRDVAIALRKDAKEWARTTVPGLVDKIAEKYLEFEWTIKVKDSVTQTSITLHGDNPTELKDTAVKRLSRMVYERADMDDFHEMLKELRHSQSSDKPNSITIGGKDGEERIGIKYETSKSNG